MGTDTDVEVFRKKMKFYRQQAGLTQDQLKDRMDVSLSTISEFERGARGRVPKRSFVVALEKELGLRNGELLTAAGYYNDETDSFDPTQGTPLEMEVQAMFRSWYAELQRTIKAYEEDEADGVEA